MKVPGRVTPTHTSLPRKGRGYLTAPGRPWGSPGSLRRGRRRGRGTEAEATFGEEIGKGPLSQRAARPRAPHTVESAARCTIGERQERLGPGGQGHRAHRGHLHSPELPKQVSAPALGFQVFSQPTPPHLIAFQSANPWPTPSAPARQATSVWPAAASQTSHGPCPSLGQPLHAPCPNHILLARPHTSSSPLTNISKASQARPSPDQKQRTNSSSPVPPSSPDWSYPGHQRGTISRKWSRTYCSISGANCSKQGFGLN